MMLVGSPRLEAEINELKPLFLINTSQSPAKASEGTRAASTRKQAVISQAFALDVTVVWVGHLSCLHMMNEKGERTGEAAGNTENATSDGISHFPERA